MDSSLPEESLRSIVGIPLQHCPKCNDIMGALPGARDAVCPTCGWKDPCCE